MGDNPIVYNRTHTIHHKGKICELQTDSNVLLWSLINRIKTIFTDKCTLFTHDNILMDPYSAIKAHGLNFYYGPRQSNHIIDSVSNNYSKRNLLLDPYGGYSLDFIQVLCSISMETHNNFIKLQNTDLTENQVPISFKLSDF